MTNLLGPRIRMSEVKIGAMFSAGNNIVGGMSDQCERFVTSTCTI